VAVDKLTISFVVTVVLRLLAFNLFCKLIVGSFSGVEEDFVTISDLFVSNFKNLTFGSPTFSRLGVDSFFKHGFIIC
jgi:hypothetical protein